MGQENWAKKYAAMDPRLMLKYEQLPNGEQIGRKPERSEQLPIPASSESFANRGASRR